ncbi:hypothetical protein [Maricaulis sp.]|uniref:hypothetical protein n=1 Tax=Maricaulis sp. TaxID=1486257 RepID=UPI003A8EF21A
MLKFLNTTSTAAIAAAALMGMAGQASADIQHLDDVIITFSLCVGTDCNNGENFGFDTLRLKENNLRLHFDDTSVSSSFPNNDWRLVANDSANGGANYFAIEDSTAGRIPFRVVAGAPASSLYVASSGNVGIGTSTPVVNLHTVSGNTPTLRLEQNGTSGFTAQTWDLGGNEANFFLRDLTHGSRMPIRVEPNTPSNTMYLDSTGRVGIGTSSPAAGLHVASSENPIARFSGTGPTFMQLDSDDDQSVQLRLLSNSESRRIVGMSGDGTVKMSQILFRDNAVEIAGATDTLDVWATIDVNGITTRGPTCNPGPCDRTFDREYFNVPSIEEHAASMWENQYLWGVGPTSPDAPYNLTEKTAGMLHELEVAHIYIEQLNSRLDALEQEVASRE